MIKKRKAKSQHTDYDISLIQRLENAGLSIRKISILNGWQYQNTHQWISRNFKRSYDDKMRVVYTKLESINKNSKVTVTPKSSPPQPVNEL